MRTIIITIIGIIILGIGIATLINPQISRWINLPGEAHLKAIISIILGTVLIILNLIIT